MSELNPDPDLVESYRERLTSDRIGLGVQGYSLGWMHGWVTQSARDHAAECALASCDTCRNLIEALSMVAAYNIEFPETLRASTDT